MHGVTWEFVSPVWVRNCLYNLKLVDIFPAVEDDLYILRCYCGLLSIKLKLTLELLITWEFCPELLICWPVNTYSV